LIRIQEKTNIITNKIDKQSFKSSNISWLLYFPVNQQYANRLTANSIRMP